MGTLGRTILQLHAPADASARSRFYGGTLPPALVFTFTTRGGERGELSEASLVAHASIELVFAPLLMKRLGEFAAVASELQEAQIVTLLRKYMRNANEVRNRDNIGMIRSSKGATPFTQPMP